MIDRILYKKLYGELYKGKALILLGARQVGKTTLMEDLKNKINTDTLFLNADDSDVRKRLSNVTSSQLKRFIGNKKLVIIDEAQRIENIGITLKLITDKIKKTQLIVSGSSAFELANKINEPLTGRKFEHYLYPLSTAEMIEHHGVLEEERMLESRLIYGMYPDVIMNPGTEKKILENLVSSYLYKDIFNFQEVRKPQIIEKLLQALALQVCHEVSYNELAQLIGVDPITVERYINLLEKTFVIFRLSSLSRNVRNELKKSKKIYFFDNGIRNAIISNYNVLDLRHDKGALWENFMVSERLKYTHYKEIYCNRFFWRTAAQQEIDLIEEREGKLFAFEFKWNAKKKNKAPLTFTKAYSESSFEVITPENYTEWIG